MEMDRGQMALHYHLFSLAALVMLAELGETNGLDLYRERDSALQRLVARCVGGLEDPSYFQQKTGVQQVTTPGIEPWQISWAQPYTRRFPDAKTSELLAKALRLNLHHAGRIATPVVLTRAREFSCASISADSPVPRRAAELSTPACGQVRDLLR
jgi:poly(beta-D-mannuronate) lyase